MSFNTTKQLRVKGLVQAKLFYPNKKRVLFWITHHILIHLEHFDRSYFGSEAENLVSSVNHDDVCWRVISSDRKESAATANASEKDKSDVICHRASAV